MLAGNPCDQRNALWKQGTTLFLPCTQATLYSWAGNETPPRTQGPLKMDITILVVQRCPCSNACFSRGTSAGILCRNLQANCLWVGLSWEAACPMLLQFGLSRCTLYFLRPWCCMYRKVRLKSARGQPSSISAFVLSQFPFTSSLSGKAADSFESWSSLLSGLRHHPC